MIASLPMNVCIACHAIPKKEGIQDPQHTAVYSQKVGVCYCRPTKSADVVLYIPDRHVPSAAYFSVKISHNMGVMSL